MQIAIIALGSRGDVQPYVALGTGLQKAGHSVRLATHWDYEALVNSHGLSFRPVEGNVQDVVESEEMRRLLEKGNFVAISARTAKEAQRVALQWARDGLAAAQGSDLLIAGIGGLNIAKALAEKLSLPLIEAFVLPFTPTKAFPGVLLPVSPPAFSGLFNRATHHLTRQMMWQGYRSADKLARQEVLGLPPAPFWGPERRNNSHPQVTLYGFSPFVLPKPVDWDETVHVTGYWYLEPAPDWTPPAMLANFLAAGPPPVYIGFGSMASRKPEETADMVLQALARAGQRAVLQAGWGGMRKTDLPDTVIMIDSVPHSWLFPQVVAVVHHGGAGTTAAGLRAGVPSVIIPHFGDQPFWGRRVAELGVGPNPIPRKKLTVARLEQAIDQATTDPVMRQRAVDLGIKIGLEDGIGRAVDIIQTLQL
jgi:sterol 3beta-glucosyltransferase